jgi:TolB-like protein/Tfp pilus assembly protein PilF
MSPEQARGKPVDARTDLFSLGVMLYEMLARRQPFTGETINHVIIAILEQEPPPLPPEVPIELAQILKQALAKNADERTPSARVLLADLKKLQKRLEFDAERARDLSPSEAEAEPAEAPTLLLKPTTAAAPEALTTAAGSRQSTSSNLTPIKPKHWLMMAVSLLVLGGGFFGYRAFAPNGKQIESIAVLPFVNASGNAEAEYLSDGMTETLISSLSQLPKLSVKARSSVFRYKGKETNPQTIGQELKVQAILNGRVVQRDDQLTLTLELVEVQTENVLWSEQYNRKQTDLVALQSEIARDVSSKLKSKLSGAEEAVLAKSYTANPEAYQLYLKGRFQWNKRTGESLRKAIEFFHQAIEQDPRYALAYAGLADAFMVLHFHGGVAPAESYGKAKTAARQALALDETLAEAHTALAYVLFRYDWKADDAFREFQRAIELNPNYPTAHHWYGESLTLAGRFDDGIAALRRAQELDPLSLVINTDIGNACYYARRYDAAIEQLHKTLELDQNFAYAYFNLGLAHTMKGQYAEALTAFRRAQQLNDGPHLLANLAYCYAASGQRAEAVQLVKQMHEIAAQRYVSAYSFAVAYAGLGERDQALQWLEKSYQDHSSDVTYVKTEPRFDNLRADPRFGDLLRRIGLSQ